MTLEDAESRYGSIIDGVWSNEAEWCSSFQVPKDIAIEWFNTATHGSTHTIYCNKDLQRPLLIALQNVRDRGLLSQLRTFDGAFNIRRVRGEPDKWSAHSYGIAIDINAQTNPLGEQGDISVELVKAFEDSGMIWGGRFHNRRDPQHFSLGW